VGRGGATVGPAQRQETGSGSLSSAAWSGIRWAGIVLFSIHFFLGAFNAGPAWF
jgi:hypothetical protein